MRIESILAMVSVACFGASAALAASSVAEVDFENSGTAQTSELTDGIASAICFDAGGQPGLLNLVQGAGLGVVGGASDQLLDSTESLSLRFSGDGKAVASHFSYTVNVANNGDGDGLSGETTVYGFGASGELLGNVSVSGTGTKQISPLFSQELSRILIVPKDNDSIRLEDFGLVAYGPTSSIEFESEPTQQVAQIDQDGITVTALDAASQPADVNTVNGFGLVVEGGPSDTLVDSGESVRFDFDGVAGRAWYQVLEAGNGDGDGLIGESRVYAWTANNHLLGNVLVSGTGTFNVTALFGGQPISFFRVYARDSDWIRIRRVAFACPGSVGAGPAPACPGDLDGDDDTDVLDFSVFLIDFGCGAP